MIINSSFHDYYDAVAKSGVDRSVRYVREPVEFQLCKPQKFRDFDKIYIWFVGDIYPIVALPITGGRTYAFTIDEVDQYVKDRSKPKEYDYYLGKRKRHPNSLFRFTYFSRIQSPYNRKEIKSFLDNSELPINSIGKFGKMIGELAAVHRSPIVSFDPYTGKAIVNDTLKKYEFMRLFDPYSTYQKIMMYLGGLANPEKPIPPVSDLDMIEAKGFDRFSFRKDPSHK